MYRPLSPSERVSDSAIFRNALLEHAFVFGTVAELELPFLDAASRCQSALSAGGKLLFCGNGGSAADAQHAAAELIGRFRRERRAVAAIALTTDSSVLTAVGNDYGFDAVFSRQIEALGRKGDVLVAISTSGNSPNVLNAVEKAARMGLNTVAVTSKDGGALAKLADVALLAPAAVTERIQEVHSFLLHCLCAAIEEGLVREAQ
jgi:D-sedoheptulose 7-phosphate isomerase